ncbi:MAG: AI-2E family transporter [Rhodothermales bacterium]|nr:AI-2E family transporter [Rhodothermales bacterium]
MSVKENDASAKAGTKPAMTVDGTESLAVSSSEVRTNAPRFTADRIIRIVVVLVGAIAFAALVWYFARLVTYLVVGIVLAYSLRPIADRIEGLGVGRITSIFSAFVVFMGLLSLLATYLVPFVASQVRELSQLVSVEEVSNIAATFEDRIARVFPIQEGAVISGVTRVFQTLFQEEGITSVMASLVGLFTNIFYAVIIVPFISFFFLKDGPRIRQGIVQFVPNRFYEITLTIIEKVETNIGRYLKGLVVQCLSIATVASILLYIVGLDYALAVGIFAGLANTIPYFGPLMGFLAGVVIGVVQTGDFSLFLGVLVAMFVTQLADNVFFQPFIFSRVAEAHPLIILFVVLIGAQLGGIVGMLLAIPVTTTLRVVVQQVVWSARNYQVLKTT